MAVNNVYQREIVEVPFVLPDGKVLAHLLWSFDESQIIEPGLFYAVLVSSKNIIPELTIPIKSEWLSSPLPKASYFVTHIVNFFNVNDVVSRHNCFLHQPYFDQVVDKVIANIVDGDF